MICPRCGKETPDNKSKCVNCGADLTGMTRLPTGGERPKTGVSPPGADVKKPPIPLEGGGTHVVPSGSGGKPGVPPGGEGKKQGPGAHPAGSGSGKPPSPKGKEGTQIVPSTPQKSPGGHPGGKGTGEPPSPAKKEGSPQKKPGGSPGGVPSGGPSPAGSQKKPPAPAPSAPQAPDPELELLRKALSGKYEITRKLGSGGMASVYHAREIALEREVAIKLLPQSFLRDDKFVVRFKREAQVAANLEHPHIVRIYQIGEEENLVYFVMSYIPGGSLSDQIKEHGPLPIDDIVQWGMDVSSALGYAHDHGVIHRDMKPDNIMLDKSKRAVVMDYGIARAAQGTGLTQTGAVIGTPQFMSPEQARGVELDARSDIYSLGLVLYQLATGTLPFEATDAASLMYMHVHETPEPPDVRNAKVPAWLRDIILKCLAKNPDDRFSHAKEVRLALAEHKAPELTERTIIQKKRVEEKKGIGIWIAAAAAVIVIAAGAYWWTSLEETGDEAVRPPVAEAPETQQAAPTQAPTQPQISQDDLAFQQAEMINTKQAYTTYMEKYPDGGHTDAAQEKIAAFEDEERKAVELSDQQDREAREEQARRDKDRQEEEEKRLAEINRQDDEAYQQAESLDTRQAYTAYLQSYPLGRNIDKARSQLAELDKRDAEQQQAAAEQQTRRDDEAFSIAMNTDTKESYSTYLISFPDGVHSGEAKSIIAVIEEREKFGEKIRIGLSELSIRMADIPGGSFQMGSNDGGNDEKPVRMVTLSGFSMSTTEITQAQYQTVMNDNPAFHKLDDNCPVEKVAWKDAITFCNRLSERMELEPCYSLSTGACDYDKNGFRLPTEAEWEFACRAGAGSEYNTGNGESALARAGWYAQNSSEKTHAVAQKSANSLGLYDMHGNVWEWTNDWYSERSYEIASAENPIGAASGKNRVLRGGGWLDYPRDCTSSKRREYDPGKNYSDIGFRIVRR